MRLLTTAIVILLFTSFNILYAQEEDLSILYPRQRNIGWLKYTDAPNFLYHHLAAEAMVLLDKRAEKESGLTGADAIKRRQQEIKTKLWELMGPFPEKTPLNAKITGKVKKNGYRIENVVYESLPGFYVSASLFIPEKFKKPAPAILFCSGHSVPAYRLVGYQTPLLNLVKKGFIVLAIDPIGQGERSQYFDTTKKASVFNGSTSEHSYPSPQVSLFGKSVARYFLWDGIRGIDYLVSRKEVDPKRIGVHGLSGGGTQTAYIAALDERVAAAAPAGFITSYKRMYESIGVQDGEQNVYHSIYEGLDHPDFITVRAPKPTLIMATTRDFFSIQGSRETFKFLKRIYADLGQPDNIGITEDDHVHGYTKLNREAMYAFFQKHLNNPGSPAEEELDLPATEELQKTATGQVTTDLNSETVWSVNLKESKEQLTALRQALKPASVIKDAKELSGYLDPDRNDAPVFAGRYQRDDYFIYRYIIEGEGSYVIPYLLFVPREKSDRAIIYLHPEGKQAESKVGGEIEFFVKKGYTVLAPDLIGTGETGPGVFQGDANIGGTSYNLWYASMIIGRSIAGIRASDVVKLTHVLQDSGWNNVSAVARREMSPVLMYAAAFEPSISRIALIEPYSSYSSLVQNRYYTSSFVHSLVPGALTKYDLPHILAAIAPRKILMAGVTDANSIRLETEPLREEMQLVTTAYQEKNAAPAFSLVAGDISGRLRELYESWLK